MEHAPADTPTDASTNPADHAPTCPQVAIDGPAGVGKSTIGERVARRLGCLYVDTGAFYRALAFLADRAGISPDDADQLTALARTAAITIAPPTVADGRQYTVTARDEDITGGLRTPTVDRTVSQVSTPASVRETLTARMREMAGNAPVVMVGRDIGTIVLPAAHVKIYLMTSVSERARRRHADLVRQLGDRAPSLETVHRDIATRDERDRTQMQPAADAVVINNDELEPAETVALIMGIIRERFPACEHAQRETEASAAPSA